MSADDLMRHGTHDFPILVRDAKQTAPHEKTEYIEAGSKDTSESTCGEGRFIHALLLLPPCFPATKNGLAFVGLSR
jgi:hypothetical protein